LKEDTLGCNFQVPQGSPLYVTQGPQKRKRQAHEIIPKGERQIDSSDPVHMILQDCIRKSFGQLYESVVLRRSTKGTKQYTVNVTGLNCRYCQNVGREHNNQNIFFVVTREGIVQRCYDNATALSAEMKYGLCSDYSSSRIPLEPSVMAKLWPPSDILFLKSPKSGLDETSGGGLSFALKALLNSGEYLSSKIFSSSWTSTLGLHTSKHRKGLKEFIPQDPRDLGSKGIQAYKTLGLSWADELCTRFRPRSSSMASEKEEDKHSFSTSILQLEQELLEVFSTIVLCSSSALEPSKTYETCLCMDDFMKLQATQ